MLVMAKGLHSPLSFSNEGEACIWYSKTLPKGARRAAEHAKGHVCWRGAGEFLTVFASFQRPNPCSMQSLGLEYPASKRIRPTFSCHRSFEAAASSRHVKDWKSACEALMLESSQGCYYFLLTADPGLSVCRQLRECFFRGEGVSLVRDILGHKATVYFGKAREQHQQVHLNLGRYGFLALRNLSMPSFASFKPRFS